MNIVEIIKKALPFGQPPPATRLVFAFFCNLVVSFQNEHGVGPFFLMLNLYFFVFCILEILSLVFFFCILYFRDFGFVFFVFCILELFGFVFFRIFFVFILFFAKIQKTQNEYKKYEETPLYLFVFSSAAKIALCIFVFFPFLFRLLFVLYISSKTNTASLQCMLYFHFVDHFSPLMVACFL